MKAKNNATMWKGLSLILVFLLASSCNLDLQVKGTNVIKPVAASGAPQPEDLKLIYGQLNTLATDQVDWYGMAEHTTDEMMGPTRGTDWDDFGTWRKLHLHTWDANHNQVVTAWNNIQQGLFQTTLLAESTTAPAQQVAEAKFLRSFWAYMSLDMYGVLQHRPATAALLDLPQVYSRKDGTEATITELEGAVANLTSYNGINRNQATKEAAYYLLAKLYLNKAVFEHDPTTPAGPFTFDPADMAKVISNCDAIIANNKLSISTKYWDNFTWTNSANSTENLFVRTNSDGINVTWQTCMGGHYNMVPSGWNGFVILSDFYDSYGKNGSVPADTVNDTRRSAVITDGSYNTLVGRNAGMLVGQVMGPDVSPTTGSHSVGQPIVALKDRSGNPLIFTRSASLFFSTESRGIRGNKYPLDPSTINSGPNASANDYVFYRYSDVLLMKAEAILRGGAATNGDTPLSLVNAIRAARGASALSAVDLTVLLAERGRELYMEAWRRNDLVRWSVFNNPVIERTSPSDPSRCVFPIPNIALSSNPNLKQNFGY